MFCFAHLPQALTLVPSHLDNKRRNQFRHPLRPPPTSNQIVLSTTSITAFPGKISSIGLGTEMASEYDFVVVGSR